MYKFIFLAFPVFLLTACTWGDSFSPENIFLKLPSITEIQTWQKKDSIGYTNTEKRWQDFQQCGVKKYFNGALDLNTQYEGMSDEEVTKRYQEIASCMKNKGYISLKKTECVDFDKKKLNGKCN